MEWIPSFTLEQGNERKIDTPQGEVSIRFRGDSLLYRRIPPNRTDSNDTTETVEKILMLDSLGKRCECSFMPVYPDRPVVFKLDDDLSVPPGENGFFCLAFEIGMAVSVQNQETIVEKILSRPRKNSYWGPPNEGLLTYQSRSGITTDPVELMNTTGFEIAVVPVHYKNRRDQGSEVERILVPLEELSLYKSEQGYLVFEVIELEHQEEFYQEPRPVKRAPNSLKTEVEQMLEAPAAPRSLFQKVRSLPRLDSLTNVFTGR